MILRQKLESLLQVVLEEASRNREFEANLMRALDGSSDRKTRARKNVEAPNVALSPTDDQAMPNSGPTEVPDENRPKNRRAKAILEPVALFRSGEAVLRAELERLNLEQLRDIVAEYGMDSGRLVMKWVTPARVIDRIVEIAGARANKGHAFRRQDD